MTNASFYFDRIAAAYVRGKLRDVQQQHEHLFAAPLDALTPAQHAELVETGLAGGLRLHRFKRTMGFARVAKVLGVLRGVQPATLLDIGSGRGAFVWPLLDAMPFLPVTAIDTLLHRVADLQAVCDGGIDTLNAQRVDATALPFADRSFDVVTMLEVLEHIPDTERALGEVCRVADRFVVLSVPSKADNNPEHIHLFDAPTITALLRAQGVARVKIDNVLNHLIVVAKVQP
jgi:ubiquinone/menaquinone biosynthesis C-methylase UbiE